MEKSAKITDELYIPSYTPIADEPLPETVKALFQQNYEDQLQKFKLLSEKEIEHNKEYNIDIDFMQVFYAKWQMVTPAKIDAIFDYLNGVAEKPELPYLGVPLSKFEEQPSIVLYRSRFQELPNCSLLHLVRAYLLEDLNFAQNDSNKLTVAISELFETEILFQQADLRQILTVLEKLKFPVEVIKNLLAKIFLFYFSLPSYLAYIPGKEDKIWPFFAENQQYFDEIFGFLPNPHNINYEHQYPKAIEILSLFPVIPTKYIMFLTNLALGAGKRSRKCAQKILLKVPNIHLQAEQALSSTKQEIRIVAAMWLAELGQKSSIKILKSTLALEKKEAVQATIIGTLKSLGDDISSYLAPNILLSEAEKGLKIKKPAAISWLTMDMIPQLRWKNGATIEPTIIFWWITLAVKLKQPSSHSLLQLYLDLIDETSKQTLGMFLLQLFIAKDTEIDPVTGQYIRSAIDAKGMLALINGVNVYKAIPIIKSYMKHSSKKSEICIVLEAIASIHNPSIIQFLSVIAKRYHSNIICKKAKQLIKQIAEFYDVTIEELVERTIPTADLDDSASLTFDYGTQIFTATLNNDFELVLKNSMAKTIKSLPEPMGNSNNDELIKTYKQQFAASKKEIKQVVKIQTIRLYEMMCVEHIWLYSDWFGYLYYNPIMSKIIQRQIWLEVDSNQKIITSFRPTDDGDFIDYDNNKILVSANNNIMLAHSHLLSKEQSEKWVINLNNYKIKPLFEQFPLLHEINKIDNKSIIDHVGYRIDISTLGKILSARGYYPINDWHRVCGYSKMFKPLGLRVCIMCSEYDRLNSENESVELYDLHFTKEMGSKNKIIHINDVPPILLQESYADYCALINEQ